MPGTKIRKDKVIPENGHNNTLPWLLYGLIGGLLEDKYLNYHKSC